MGGARLVPFPLHRTSHSSAASTHVKQNGEDGTDSGRIMIRMVRTAHHEDPLGIAQNFLARPWPAWNWTRGNAIHRYPTAKLPLDICEPADDSSTPSFAYPGPNSVTLRRRRRC